MFDSSFSLFIISYVIIEVITIFIFLKLVYVKTTSLKMKQYECEQMLMDGPHIEDKDRRMAHYLKYESLEQAAEQELLIVIELLDNKEKHLFPFGNWFLRDLRF